MTGIQEEYARALFQLAMEHDLLNDMQTGFLAFVEALDDDTMHFFNHPKITKQEKRDVLEKAVSLELLRHFLFVLVDNERMSLSGTIYYAFVDLINQMKKVKQVKVYAKQKLTVKQKDTIRQKLEKSLSHSIEIEELIDETIFSGIRIEIDGMIIDETSNRQLEDLKANLKRG